MKKIILLISVLFLISCDKREEIISKSNTQDIILPENEGNSGIIIGNGGNGTNCYDGIGMACDNLLEFSNLQ